MSATSSDVELAARLVAEAGRLAQTMRAAGLDATEKTSVSDLVTAADHAAEAFVVDSLRKARPDDAILGEEGTDHPGTSGRRWVIDPVDGTYNFFHGLTWWCSALALTEDDDVVLGAVHHPHDDVTLIGGRGWPTSRNGVALPKLVDRPLPEVSAATYFHPPWYADRRVLRAFESVVTLPATVRMLGSGSMDLSAVAQGRLGVYFQPSVPLWDWLPGKALVEAAGGASAQVDAGGVTWSVAGVPSAVSDVVDALGNG